MNSSRYMRRRRVRRGRTRAMKLVPGQRQVSEGLSDLVRAVRVIKTGVYKVNQSLSSGSDSRDLNRATTKLERAVMSAISEFGSKSARILRGD